MANWALESPGNAGKAEGEIYKYITSKKSKARYIRELATPRFAAEHSNGTTYSDMIVKVR